MELLTRLHILSTVQEQNQPLAYRLSKPFVSSLRLALTGGGDHRSFGVPCDTPAARKIDVKYLDDFARTQWEAILYYIVGSAGSGVGAPAEISPSTKTLLAMGDFVEIKGRHPSITQAGFTFLLQEVNAQVWSLLIVYLENSDQLGMDSVDVLSFLFMLGSLEVGQDYSTAMLSPTQQQMLDDLNDFGIIYRDAADLSRFYPTRLATTLTSDSNALTTSLSSGPATAAPGTAAQTNQKGFIVVETNYRIYAYTNSPLRIAILNLFTKLSTRYPNMVSGRLTRESIQNAIALGITSQQIISYLTAHAHPIMGTQRSGNATNTPYAAQQTPSLPPTVVDQIRLWQIEGDRMKATPGFLFREFRDRQEYEDCANFADTIGVLVWRSDPKRVFFVTKHEQIAGFIANRRRRPEANGTG